MDPTEILVVSRRRCQCGTQGQARDDTNDPDDLDAGETSDYALRMDYRFSAPHGETMKYAMPLLLVAVLLGLASCATTTFTALPPQGEGVYEGRGGTKSVLDGMDIWSYGDPSRRYRVLGLIEDQRRGEAKQVGELGADVVSKARAVGGQALIQLSSRVDVVGVQDVDGSTGTAHGNTAAVPGSTTPVPIRRITTRFFVIQYID